METSKGIHQARYGRMIRDQQIETHIQRGDGPLSSVSTTAHEPSLGDLLKRLTTDTGRLIGQEVQLAKAEATQAGTALIRDGSRIGTGVAIAFAGSLSLVAFLVIGLGTVLGGNYWLSSLIVGGAGTGIGMMMAKNAAADAKRRVNPEATINSMKENVAWAKHEAHELNEDLTNDSTPTQPRR